MAGQKESDMAAVKSNLMASAATVPTYRNDAETEEKKALEEEKKEGAKAVDDAAKADADAGEKLDRMLSCLDSMSKRMDALEKADEFPPEKKDDDDDDDDDDDKRKDKRKDSRRKDNGGDEDDKPAFMKDKRKDSRRKDEHDEKIAADKRRKDDDEDEDDDKAKKLAADKRKDDDDDDAKRKDSRADSDLAEMRAQIARLERARNVTDEDRATMATIQARADSAYMMLGDSAPRFMDGEEPLAYRRRLLKKIQAKSATWKDADLAKADSAVLDIAEKQIYADAVAGAMNPTDLAEGHLRMLRKQDETGRTHITWAGQPRAWMQQFMAPTRRVTQFETRSQQR